MPSTVEAINTMEDFIRGLQGGIRKAAAEANTEPGSIGGETEHPVKDVDDRTETAQTGERSAENTKDVKKDQGESSVDSTADAKAAAVRRLLKRAGGAAATPGSAADDQIQTGTNKQPTGDDPAVETSSVKGGKKDPGSSHPARTDNTDLAGGKYASDTPLEKIAHDVKVLGERICARLNIMGGYAGQQPVKSASAEQRRQVDVDPGLAYSMGSELASLLNGTMDKRAADQMVHRTLCEVIKRASDDADNYAAYVSFLFEQEEAARKAAEEAIPPEMLAAGSEAGGGLPTGGMPGEGGPMGGGDDPAAMMAALGGGAAAEESGMPPEEGGGEGGEIDPETLQALIEQLGITEDDIGDAAEEEMGGGGDPGAGGGGGLPPEVGAEGPPPKMGADKGRKSGKSARDAGTEFFRELISRSRAAR